jgi:hypothetical protein
MSFSFIRPLVVGYLSLAATAAWANGAAPARVKLPAFQSAEGEIDPLYQTEGCHWVSADEKELACTAITVCEGCMEYRIEVRKLGSKKRAKFVLLGGERSDYQPKGFASAQKYLDDHRFYLPKPLPASAASVRQGPGPARALLLQVDGQTLQAKLPKFDPRQVPTKSERPASDLPADWPKIRATPAAQRIAACCSDKVAAVYLLPQTRRVLALVTSRCEFAPEPANRLCLFPDYNAENDTESGFAVYDLALPAVKP